MRLNPGAGTEMVWQCYQTLPPRLMMSVYKWTGGGSGYVRLGVSLSSDRLGPTLRLLCDVVVVGSLGD